MTIENDPMGQAIADYHKHGKAAQLRVISPVLEDDEIPVKTLFRSLQEMPAIERVALEQARGHILDVGAGAGCHSLALQGQGKPVTAIDISPVAVATMRERGVVDVLEQDFFTYDGPRFDTILMLMNGIGIVGTVSRLPAFFMQVDRLLADGGQLLCDSSDICYIYEDEDGFIDLTGVEGYYGEMTYQMQYRGVKGSTFPWLFVDADTLREQAAACGFDLEIVLVGDHYDYLARITRRRG